MLLGQASGHTYFSPLDFLRHDSASTKWGERKPGAGQIGGGGAYKTTSLYSYIQGCVSGALQRQGTESQRQRFHRCIL